MTTSRAAKAASRAALYRRAITSHHDSSHGLDAVHEALRWLRSEAAHLERRHPRYARALYTQLTAQIATLAEFLADAGQAALIATPAEFLAAPGQGGGRAARRRAAVTEALARPPYRDALPVACGWLQAEARHADDSTYRQLTDRIATLAESVPGFRPARHEGST